MTKPINKSRSGMTLVEVLVVVSILALLAAFIIPAYNLAMRRREISLAASKFRTAAATFAMYRSETGAYPPTDSTRGTIPPEMAGYFADLKIDKWWTQTTELGGKWDWDINPGASGSTFKYRITIADATKTDQMVDLDKLIDDGNLSTGNFRLQDAEYCYSLGE